MYQMLWYGVPPKNPLAYSWAGTPMAPITMKVNKTTMNATVSTPRLVKMNLVLPKSVDRLDQFKRAFRSGLSVHPLLESECCCLLRKLPRELLLQWVFPVHVEWLV